MLVVHLPTCVLLLLTLRLRKQERPEGTAPLSGVPTDNSSAKSVPSSGEERSPRAGVAAARHVRTSSANVPHPIGEGVMDRVQERADAAMTLSGLRISNSQSASTTEDEISPRPRGVHARGRARSGVSRPSMESSASHSPRGTNRGAGSPRRGKYQVKDSFNRLKGWINGGFAGGNSRRNNAHGGELARGAGKGGASARARGPSAAGAGSAAATARRAGSKNLTPNAGVDRAAARVEARKAADREALKAAREAGAVVARQGPARSPKSAARHSPRSQVKAVGFAREKATPAFSAPSTPASEAKSGFEALESAPLAHAADAGGVRGGTSSAADHRGRARVRPLRVANAGSSSSPSPSPRSPYFQQGRGAAAATEVGAEAVPRKVKASASAAATTAAAVAVSPTSARMAVVAPALSAPAPSRAKTLKAAKSLGATIPPLSPATRSAGGTLSGRSASKSPRLGGKCRTPVESPGPIRSPRSAGRSPVVGFATEGLREGGGGGSGSGGRLPKGRKSVRGGAGRGRHARGASRENTGMSATPTAGKSENAARVG